MKVVDTNIPEVKIISLDIYKDPRGMFVESWRDTWAKEIGLEARLVQDNFSRSVANTLRGLHYQVEQPQAKLVRVTTGSVFDVAVDLRRSSPTFGSWVGVELSAENGKMLYIPKGFAHGFLVLSEIVEYTYKCSDYYYPQGERTLMWDDKDVGIDWPIPNRENLVISEKDLAGVSLVNCECFE
ncbi:MAG: dTDP-4-dehydrorhamnose 3,5-epimerase [Pseudomonadales bacterium]|nr:dTDP-4-dehydrorhamnose 3,5-epimerase [Pseudomonadales bacterium]